MTVSVDDSKIAARYARALFEQVVEGGKDVDKTLDSIAAELASLAEVMTVLPDLQAFLSNPGVPQKDKVGFIRETFEPKLSPMVTNLVRLMAENGRMVSLPAVACKFQEMVDAHYNVATAQVTTASELSADLEKQLAQTITKAYGFSRVELEKVVNPEILGGVILKIQDKVIDGSFSGRLNKLQKSLA